jgi:triosephosphate isomerase
MKTVKKYITEQNIKLAVRFILGGVFIFAGVSKLVDPKLFIRSLQSIIPLSDIYIIFFTYGFILFEIVLGLVILFYINHKVLLITISTLSILCIYLMYKIYINDNSFCGCFGSFLVLSNKKEFVNNLILLMISIYLT